jgi:hypothetical protein
MSTRPFTFRRHHCDVCSALGTVPAGPVFGRGPQCTCGAGPFDELTLHAGDCDTVPCPFCQLLGDPEITGKETA